MTEDPGHTDPEYYLKPLELCFVFTHIIMLHVCPIYYYILYVLSLIYLNCLLEPSFY